MLDALTHLGIFLLQTLIVITAILIVLAGILALLGKNKGMPEAKITVKKLNKKYDELKKIMREETLPKKTLKTLLKQEKKNKKDNKKEKNAFVINFNGDMKASDVEPLREEITALLTIATKKDEVIVRLESSGGAMHAYGLAASQLLRIKEKHIPLTVCIDKVAASGGYMMACVANKIISAPFAIVGSIGVIAQLPNFHRLLKDKHVDFEQVTAGQYKRTLTVFGKNTEEGRAKFQSEIDEAHDLFKQFIDEHRPQINIEKVATGEHWFAKKAFEYKLVDTLSTSDDYLLKLSDTKNIFEVTQKKKKSLIEKFTTAIHSFALKLFSAWWQQDRENRYL